MGKYNTSGAVLMGLVCLNFANVNTSVEINHLDMMKTGSYVSVNDYGNVSSILMDYTVPKSRLGVELEANAMFGNMREATVAEQKHIQDSIDEISVSTGFNFWD